MSTPRYPACPECGRPLFPHVDGELCCVNCRRIVKATPIARARASDAAQADGMGPLKGDFTGPSSLVLATIPADERKVRDKAEADLHALRHSRRLAEIEKERQRHGW